MGYMFFRVYFRTAAFKDVQSFFVFYPDPRIFQKFKNCLMHLVDFLSAEDLDGSASQWHDSHYLISYLKSGDSLTNS
jgi:hypothetical protein